MNTLLKNANSDFKTYKTQHNFRTKHPFLLTCLPTSSVNFRVRFAKTSCERHSGPLAPLAQLMSDRLDLMSKRPYMKKCLLVRHQLQDALRQHMRQ